MIPLSQNQISEEEAIQDDSHIERTEWQKFPLLIPGWNCLSLVSAGNI